MSKNKTEQNRNDEIYNQTGITVKIHSNHDGVWANMIMLKSIAARSSWRSPVITASLRNYIGRPSSEKIRACSEWKVPSITAAEFCGAVIPSDLHVPVNSAVVHSKNTRLEQFVFYLVMWKTRVFLWAIIRLKFTEHFTSRFCIRDLKTSGKSVKFDLPNYFSL